MQDAIRALAGFGSDHGWLISANFSLSVLLFAWLLRYRRLYLRAEAARAGTEALITHLSDGIFIARLDGSLISVNPAMASILGYASVDALIEANAAGEPARYLRPERRDEYRETLQREGRITEFVSEIERRGSGSRAWIAESARLVSDPVTGRPLHIEGILRDITDDMRRFQLEERLEKLTSQVPGGFFQVLAHADGHLTPTFSSSGLMPTLGLSGAFDPMRVAQRVHEDDLSDYQRTAQDAGKAQDTWTHEFRIRTDSGTIRWLAVVATPEPTAEGVLWHGHVADVTERKVREMRIADLAYFDALTGLPNRRMLLDRIPQAIAAAGRRKNHGALLFIDIDDFKLVNDTYGHDAGDEYLRQAGELLRRAVRRNDLVARIGGDEFVVLVEDVGVDADIARGAARVVAEKTLATLRTGFRVGKIQHNVGASIGVFVFDGTEASADEVLKCADLAMYDGKGTGKNAVNVFDPGLLDRQAARYRLVRELHNAIIWERLVLHFQPIVDRDGRVAGAEGLVRWPHPTRGLLEPEDFVLLAERAGLLNDMSKLVLNAGMETLAAWQAERRTAHLTLALNLSTPAFLTTEFAAMLRRLIDLHGVDASKLTLELTEQVMGKDKDLVRRRMEEVKALGVRFSLDDFGSGHSSLGYLKLFPFDEIKIDGSFVSRLDSQDVGRMMVKTILAMAETLELETVAEHVETETQLDFLMANGCDRFQGYLFAAPKRAEDFLALVRGEPADIISLQARRPA